MHSEAFLLLSRNFNRNSLPCIACHQRRLNYYAIFTWRRRRWQQYSSPLPPTLSQLVMVDGRAYNDNNKSFASKHNNNNHSFIAVFMVRLHFNCVCCVSTSTTQWECDAFEICVSGRDATPHAWCMHAMRHSPNHSKRSDNNLFMSSWSSSTSSILDANGDK